MRPHNKFYPYPYSSTVESKTSIAGTTTADLLATAVRCPPTTRSSILFCFLFISSFVCKQLLLGKVVSPSSSLFLLIELRNKKQAMGISAAAQIASVGVSLVVLVLFQASVGEGKPFQQLGRCGTFCVVVVVDKVVVLTRTTTI